MAGQFSRCHIYLYSHFISYKISSWVKLKNDEISREETLIIEDEINHHIHSMALAKAHRLLESFMLIESQRYFIAVYDRCPNEIENYRRFFTNK